MNENPNRIMPELVLNWDLAVDMLIRFIQTETNRVGFEKLVIGLSGGIDSALSAYLAVKALGSENVIPCKMPYATSSSKCIEYSEVMADFLGIKCITFDITKPVDEFSRLLGDLSNIRRGNIMARTRMIILYDTAAKNKALVLGTGNKTEILLGYTTLYGDSACSLNPIGDLYKTQVWEIAAFLGLPREIIAQVPSADLWTGQTDEEELGLTYQEADGILYHLVDLRLKREEVVRSGYEMDKVDRVLHLMRKNQFKRTMPPIPKLSPRSIGSDFLYSRDWGT